MQNKREREETTESVATNEDTISKKQRNEPFENSSETLAPSSIPVSAPSDSKAHAELSEKSSASQNGPEDKSDTKGQGETKAHDNLEETKNTRIEDGNSENCSEKDAATAEAASQEKAEDSTSGNKTANSGTKLGFGAFASRTAPFKSATALTQKAEDAADKVDKDWAASSNEKVSENQEIVVRKKEVQRPDLECEEDETTVYSSRVKLYSMAKDQSWKERGTGALKLNYQESNKAARLGMYSYTNVFVMRSEGVLKLILNVKLFAGMQCDLEQDRFLRLVAMEPEGLTHFAIKFANATEASTFLKELKTHIPTREARALHEE